MRAQKAKGEGAGVIKRATVSDCGKYRYTLERVWDETKSSVLFICLNPSTADAEQDDPTVLKIVRYARSWGHGGISIGNLFAFRATEPSNMKAAADPVGPDNNAHLKRLSEASTLTLVAWGAAGSFRGRDREVLALLSRPHHLALTIKGAPKHPLYLPGSLKPQAFSS